MGKIRHCVPECSIALFPTSQLHCPNWCTGLEPYAINTAYMRSSCSWGIYSGENGYNNRQIHRDLNRRPNFSRPEDKPDSIAFLPYIRTLFNRISRVLSRHNIKSVGLPPNKLSSLLWPVMDSLG
jgi:hypothetical protein